MKNCFRLKEIFTIFDQLQGQTNVEVTNTFCNRNGRKKLDRLAEKDLKYRVSQNDRAFLSFGPLVKLIRDGKNDSGWLKTPKGVA